MRKTKTNIKSIDNTNISSSSPAPLCGGGQDNTNITFSSIFYSASGQTVKIYWNKIYNSFLELFPSFGDTGKVLNNIHTLSLIPFLNIDIPSAPESLSGFEQFLFGVLMISIVLLWCFVNVIGYFCVLYGIKYLDIETKYAKYKPIINYFKKLNFVFVIVDVILIIGILVSVIGVISYFLYINKV